MYLFRVVEAPKAITQPNENIPLVLLPAAEPLCAAKLADATPQAVEVQLEYVYLFLVAIAAVAQEQVPSANMPLVLFPVAEPLEEATLAAPTPLAVEVQLEYVCLFLVLTPIPQLWLSPNANIPRVLFPAADWFFEDILAVPTPQAVEALVA